jgi:hypothetical protein
MAIRAVRYLRPSPITIASLTYGDVLRLFSISDGEMFLPPDVMMMCLIRSMIFRWVPSTQTPTSPVLSQPSSVNVSAVSSGLPH